MLAYLCTVCLVCLCTLQDVVRLLAYRETETTELLPTSERVLIIDEVNVNIYIL